MNTKTHIILTLALALLTVAITRAQVGKSGLSFLKLGASAREIAMGDAMSADVSGAAATYYNPAGLLKQHADDSRVQVLLMHKEWIQDTRTEYFGTSVRLDESNALGFFLNSTTVSEIEIRTRPGMPEGTFTARNFSVGASYARAFGENFRVGLTGKFLYEKIFIDEASGLAVDLGMQYSTPVENLTVGATVANLGKMNELRTQSTKLPSMLRLGPAYSFDVESVNARVLLTSDLMHFFPESKSHVNVGGEIFFNQTVAARAGYITGSQGRNFSAGIGLRYGILAFDYAYVPFSLDLGNSHVLTLILSP